MNTDLVADTSPIIPVIANEPEKPLLIAKTRGYDLIAPRSLRWEIGNAFSAMIKRGRITLEQARQRRLKFTSAFRLTWLTLI